MTPFRVLRVFGLLLFSWLLLCLGVYLSYESYRHFTARPLVVDSISIAELRGNLSEASGGHLRSLEADALDPDCAQVAGANVPESNMSQCWSLEARTIA